MTCLLSIPFLSSVLGLCVDPLHKLSRYIYRKPSDSDLHHMNGSYQSVVVKVHMKAFAIHILMYECSDLSVYHLLFRQERRNVM